MTVRAAFIGCVAFSATMLERLLVSPHLQVIGIATRSASPFNADFQSMAPLAAAHAVACLEMESNDPERLSAWLAGLTPDVIFCCGWSYLLPASILSLPRFGVIGYHPALLPRNRGRHPIVWALALGLERTGSTFFVMDEGADSGDIVSQRTVAITTDDDAASLYARLASVAEGQIDNIAGQLGRNRLERQPQDPALATSWRKRGRADGRIDWRMTAASIHNLVRALTRPYVGAHVETPNGDIKVWRVEPGPWPRADIEPGQILRRDGGRLTVKCADGCVTLVEHDFTDPPPVGDYL